MTDKYCNVDGKINDNTVKHEGMYLKVASLKIIREPDYDADISYLETDNEKDKEHLKWYGVTWHMIGIYAVAEVLSSQDGKNWLINHIRSGGLWGIEEVFNKPDEEYYKEIGNEEVKQLYDLLKAMNFNAEGMTVETVEK